MLLVTFYYVWLRLGTFGCVGCVIWCVWNFEYVYMRLTAFGHVWSRLVTFGHVLLRLATVGCVWVRWVRWSYFDASGRV